MRIGTFTVSAELIGKRPDIVQAIMGRCIIIRCEMMYSDNCLHYKAISTDFDDVENGTTIPKYDVQVSESQFEFELKFVRETKMRVHPLTKELIVK